MNRILAQILSLALLSLFPLSSRIASAADGSPFVLMETVTGQQIRAQRVISLDATEIELDLGASNQRFSIETIAKLRWSYSDEVAPPLTITLRDGSQLRARSVESTDGDAVLVKLRGLNPLALDLKQLRAVRFRPANPAVDPVWLGRVEEPKRKDTLVIRSSDDSLRPIDGTLIGFDLDKVRFDLLGDVISAPIDRLEGIVFAAVTDGGDAQTAPFLVEDINGSRFTSASIAWRDDSLAINMDESEGATLLIPRERLRRVEFRSGVQALIGCDVAESDYVTMDTTKLDANVLTQWLGPEVIGQDLAMNAGSQITYRIPSGFDRFVAAIKRDPQIYRRGTVIVKLALDGETVWETSLRATQDQDRNAEVTNDRMGEAASTDADDDLETIDVVGIDQPIGDARRLTLLLTSVAGGDRAEPGVGGRVQWIRPRLIK